MTKDFLGLNKVEKDLEKALNFDLFPKERKEKKQKKRKNTSEYQPRPRKQKPIMTKQQQQETIKFLKDTGSAFSKLGSAIKNRKIRKLEKQAVKNLEKAQALAHKIKTIQANSDALIDIARYEKELEKLEQENREREAQIQDKTNQDTHLSDEDMLNKYVPIDDRDNKEENEN